METGRVVNRRYLLQRLIKQGQICTIYQGVDQVLQRTVAVKTVPAPHIPVYRTALRLTAQFSHPNIIGLYDLIPEAETLYIVQEYVESDDFAVLVQTQLTPYEVADFGCQVCIALIYASNSTHNVCHGDLTPTAIMRNRSGLVRINNFALPSDPHYFASWSVVGGESGVPSNRELPWGQQSEGRKDDDIRATGLLLYQLLAGRPPNASVVEPPIDGSLRFLRNSPPELCDVVARAAIRQHPQHITTPEVLYAELKRIVEALEPLELATQAISNTPSPYQQEESPIPRQFSPAGTGKLVTALPVREGRQLGSSLSSYSAKLSTPNPEAAAAPTVADVSLKLAAARQAAYPQTEAQPQLNRPPILVILLICLLVFALCFVIGYLGGHLFFGP